MNENNDLNIQTTEETTFAEPTPVEPAPIEQPVSPVEPIAPAEPVITSAPEAPKKKGSKTPLIIIIVVLGVLLLTAISYIAYDKFKDELFGTKEPTSSTTKKDDNTNTTKTTTTTTTTSTDTKVVGDDDHGYVTVPNNWYKFYDTAGAHALQYSYASVFILSLDVVPDTTNKMTAKMAADNYSAQELQNTNATNVTGAIVKIGKNKEYTAYQVYSYYPADNSYLVTYWFEAEDGKIHYMALEGPSSTTGTSITDFTDTIPYTFSLKK